MIRDQFLVGSSRMAVVVLAAASVIGCQALKEALPTKPTEPTPAPSQAPVAIPVILPAPQPTPTPVLGAPAPAPTPAPGSTPAPAPPPSGGSCSLPPSNFPDAGCSMQSSSFLGAVDQAITKVTQQQPSLFEFNLKTCENCYLVKDQSAFVSAVMRNLSNAGYCSTYDGEELGVKNSNSFNEQFDILVSSGHIRRGGGSYRSTCSPSWF